MLFFSLILQGGQVGSRQISKLIRQAKYRIASTSKELKSGKPKIQLDIQSYGILDELETNFRVAYFVQQNLLLGHIFAARKILGRKICFR